MNPATTHTELAAPRTRLTERKRAAIISAAIAEFLAAGYESASMDSIAARAGTSKRTVYNHFVSKEALFTAILEQLWDACVGGEVVRFDAARPLRDQLLAIVQQKFTLLNDAAFVSLARVAIAAGIHSPERAQAMVARLNEREEGLTEWIAQAAKAGYLQLADPSFAATQLQGLLKTFAFWPQVILGQAALSPLQQIAIAASSVDMFLAFYERPAVKTSG